MTTATAIAHPNIAFIKYWGNRDDSLRIPANGSISMNLGGLFTRTEVRFDPGMTSDQLTLNGDQVSDARLSRVVALLDRVRDLAGIHTFAEVISSNNFPTGAGIASSASAFAALALAASSAAGLDLDEHALSRLARLGSGSACRSVPGGFVEWLAGEDEAASYAVSIAPASHWDLVDCVAVASQAHKATGSTEGHSLAATSPVQAARLQDAPRRLDLCRQAILERDFEALASVAELDSHLMHAVMQTSNPPLLYWQPATIAIMQAVIEWRQQGTPCFYTIDAGPNVHVIVPAAHAPSIAGKLQQVPGVIEVITAPAGGPACLVEPDRRQRD